MQKHLQTVKDKHTDYHAESSLQPQARKVCEEKYITA